MIKSLFGFVGSYIVATILGVALETDRWTQSSNSHGKSPQSHVLRLLPRLCQTHQIQLAVSEEILDKMSLAQKRADD